MPCDLARIDADAWSALAAAAADPASGFRYLTLCTVDAEGAPQARMVVLRHAEPGARELEIHTDARSPKWQQLRADPRATLLGFCARERSQLRLQGVVALHAPGSERARIAWARLPAWTRQTYTGGPPGDPLAFDPIAEAAPDRTSQHAAGQAHFGVLAFRACTLDWFQLRRQDNQRARFVYGEHGALVERGWINP